ncbi:hypothetical protein [Streptomyces sp. NPDC060322]|uniref:hypothetical protein n=1 Tax=Streptomyces sp. NPDC060322 TaxID=3347097 RepID=UPI003661B8DC
MTDCPDPGRRTRTERTGERSPGRARRMSAYCLRDRTDLLLAFGAALVAAVATAAPPLVLRHGVDGVAGAARGPSCRGSPSSPASGPSASWRASPAATAPAGSPSVSGTTSASGRTPPGTPGPWLRRPGVLVARSSEEVAPSRSRMVVAHRLTTAARADRVVVLDDG